jgi:hypothetical protein
MKSMLTFLRLVSVFSLLALVSGSGGCSAGGGGGDEDGWDAGTDAGGDDAADAGPDAGGDSGSPLDLPLLHLSNFEYRGAFRLPAADYGISSMNYSQGPLAYDPGADSIFIIGHTYQQAVAEFAVPALVNSTVIGDLNMAGDPVQTFMAVIDKVGSNPQQMDRVGGMAHIDGPSGVELLVNVYEYYDAPGDDTHTSVVVRSPDDLAGSAVDGFYSLQGRAHAAGWISPVPPEWQALLEDTHITGSSSGMPIISRLSVGPSAFAFDPLDIVGSSAAPGDVATTALLDFSLDHPLHEDLSNDSRANDIWTHLSRAVYGFIAPGTRTYVTVGSTGGHATGVCYKCTPNGATEACGGYCANDVSDYANYYWLWDVADLLAVREGTLDPWEVRPYEYGEFPAPFGVPELGGGAYDAASGLLYLTVQRADTQQGTYSNPPIVVAYGLQ